MLAGNCCVVLLKNFVAAAVFSVSYFRNVVEEFRSCLSKPGASVCHFVSSFVLRPKCLDTREVFTKN